MRRKFNIGVLTHYEDELPILATLHVLKRSYIYELVLEVRSDNKSIKRALNHLIELELVKAVPVKSIKDFQAINVKDVYILTPIGKEIAAIIYEYENRIRDVIERIEKVI